MLYSVFMVIGYLSTDLNAVYIARSDKILSGYRKKFQDIGMTWKIGPNRLWLELWLDFVNDQREQYTEMKDYTQVVDYPNFKDNEDLSQVSNMNTPRASNVKEFLERRNREFGLRTNGIENVAYGGNVLHSPRRIGEDDENKRSPSLLPSVKSSSNRQSRINSILSLNDYKGKESVQPKIMIELVHEKP